jgi:hypothetical protein
MDLEFHQLDLRYQSLRRRAPEREKRLLASLAQHGQQAPIVVVTAEGGARVVVDGYKRVRALKTLKADTVQGNQCMDGPGRRGGGSGRAQADR